MIYELRSYDIRPETFDAFDAWGQERAIPVLIEQFKFRLIGRWQGIAKTGEEAPATNFHWMIAWEDEDEMRARWAEAVASPAWQEAVAAATDPATGEGKYIIRTRSVLLRPLAWSPLQ